MRELATHARDFTTLLSDAVARARSIHAIVLVDRDGLPMASTLGPGELEDGLGATTTDAARWLRYATGLCSLGATFRIHVAAQERQLFLIPVHGDVWLVALCDAMVSQESATTHLLALAREIVVCGLSPLPYEPETPEASP
jgi:predicted regulator of Ras-like GTPase activity (Roadblock/LC7/MglB family)